MSSAAADEFIRAICTSTTHVPIWISAFTSLNRPFPGAKLDVPRLGAPRGPEAKGHAERARARPPPPSACGRIARMAVCAIRCYDRAPAARGRVIVTQTGAMVPDNRVHAPPPPAAAAVSAAYAAKTAARAAAAAKVKAAAARQRANTLSAKSKAVAERSKPNIDAVSAKLEVRTSVVHHQLRLEEMHRLAAHQQIDRVPVPEAEPEPEPDPPVLAWHRCVAAIGYERGGTWGHQSRALAKLYRDTLGQNRNPTDIMLNAGARDTFPLRPVSVSQWRVLCAALSVKYKLPDPEKLEAELNLICGGSQHPQWNAIKRELSSSIGLPIPTLADARPVIEEPPPVKEPPGPGVRTLMRRWRSPAAGSEPFIRDQNSNLSSDTGRSSPCNADGTNSVFPVDALIVHARQENALLRSRVQRKLEDDVKRLSATRAATNDLLQRREDAVRSLESSLQCLSGSDPGVQAILGVSPKFDQLGKERDALAELRLRSLVRQCATMPSTASTELARVNALWARQKHERALDLVRDAQRYLEQEKVRSSLDSLGEAALVVESLQPLCNASVEKDDGVRATRASISELRRRAEQLSTLQCEEAYGDAVVHCFQPRDNPTVGATGLSQATKHYDASLRALRGPDDLNHLPERNAVRRVQKKRADVFSLIRAESDAMRETLVSQMTTAASTAAQKIIASDELWNLDATSSDGGLFSTPLNKDAIARAQLLCADYRESAKLCEEALALDQACSTWSTAQRMQLEALLSIAEERAQVQGFLGHARTEMALGEFAQAVETLAAAAEASGKVFRVVDKQSTSDTDMLLASAAQRQCHHIGALRALAMKEAAELDLRNCGTSAMLSVRKHQTAANECAPTSLDAVPRHDPHPYWNPTEVDRRNLYDLYDRD